MAESFTVSVQVTGYENSEQLSRIIKGILSQQIDFSMEINLTDNGTVAELTEFLAEFPLENVTCNILEKENDFYGVTKASGKYVAFCCFNDFWNDPHKLAKQVQFLEENSAYSSCVHNIDVIDSKARSYRYALQQKYKNARFSPDKVCDWKRLQKYVIPGAISTLVCRNIFNKEHIDKWLNTPHSNSKLCLFLALTLEGPCCNLYKEYWTTRYCKYPSRSNMPFYSYEDAKNEINELNSICDFSYSYYGVRFDKSFRLIQIASLNFEFYKKSKKTPEELEHFLEIYEAAYKPEYDVPVEKCHEYAHEKNFFDYLRSKLYWYQLQHGTSAEAELLRHMYVVNDEARIERILQCYRYSGKANAELRNRLIQEADDSGFVKKQVQTRLVTAPFRKVSKKVIGLGKKIHKTFKRMVTYRLRKKGFSPYMANEWYDSVRINLFTDKTTPLKDKLWCYRRGFMPWRLFQYGITEENYKQCLSDRDYMFLHQINNTYKKWIEDKMTFRYVLEPFKEYLPKYYYQIIRREGCPLLLRLMDCPEGYDGTFDEMFRLLREKGALALKAASGTHGVGFYKMAYENGKYYMNNEESSEYEIMQIIRNFKNYYVITEYITMHDEIKRLYGGSVNTIRIMMINRDGLNPQLWDAYMRIGSSTTGTTDNVAFGGVFCRIDMETGHYGNAEQSKNHVLVGCPYHPDTNELIEGTIPHWDLIKEKTVEISRYMGPLEYLGFDIVCTPEGFTVLEINSHQDLHRYIYYDNRIKQFLFDKLEYKHRLYKR